MNYWLLLLALSASAVGFATAGQPFVAVIHVPGDRTPKTLTQDTIIPSCEACALTATGRRQMRSLGAAVRNVLQSEGIIGLPHINTTYNFQRVATFATQSPAALTSATEVLNGMFPLGSRAPYGTSAGVADPVVWNFDRDLDQMLQPYESWPALQLLRSHSTIAALNRAADVMFAPVDGGLTKEDATRVATALHLPQGLCDKTRAAAAACLLLAYDYIHLGNGSVVINVLPNNLTALGRANDAVLQAMYGYQAHVPHTASSRGPLGFNLWDKLVTVARAGTQPVFHATVHDTAFAASVATMRHGADTLASGVGESLLVKVSPAGEVTMLRGTPLQSGGYAFTQHEEFGCRMANRDFYVKSCTLDHFAAFLTRHAPTVRTPPCYLDHHERSTQSCGSTLLPSQVSAPCLHYRSQCFYAMCTDGLMYDFAENRCTGTDVVVTHRGFHFGVVVAALAVSGCVVGAILNCFAATLGWRTATAEEKKPLMP